VTMPQVLRQVIGFLAFLPPVLRPVVVVVLRHLIGQAVN
jgi:hypothetical protein